MSEHVTGPLVGGEIVAKGKSETIQNPYTQTDVAIVHQADDQLVEEAIARSVEAFEKTRKMPAYERARILSDISSYITSDREVLAQGICAESGKPISAALGEVDRAAYTFSVAAEESKRIGGEVIDLDWLPGNEQRSGHVMRVSKGPVSGITPFNFPINLVAHKVAPALAAGNPILIKPAPQTPITAIRLGQILLKAGWPADAVAILPCGVDEAKPLVSDERIKMLSFTGSPGVGWMLKGQAGRKMVTLELGGNAGNIICQDAAIDYALDRVMWGGFVNAGQACISVQRVYIQAAIYEACKAKLIDRVSALPYGDPSDPQTIVGPVIDARAADKIEQSLSQAQAHGASILVGGTRDAQVIAPTLVECDDDALEISREEIFGPVIVISRFEDFSEAINRVNDSDYGLQAGVFTQNMANIHQATEELAVGGVNINDVSTYRIDHMPYGGVKASGFGREGLKYAIEEMTEMKLITYNHSIYSF